MRKIAGRGNLTLLALFAGVLALALSATPASADTIDWSITSLGGGSISYAGGANPLIISNVTVGSVTDTTTSTLVTITSGLLNLTSGNLSGSNSTDWFFGANNTAGAVTITGCATGIAICTTDLLTGTVSGATVVNTGTGVDITIAVILNSVNTTLLSDLGIVFPLNQWQGTLNLSFVLSNSAAAPPGAFSSTGSTGSGDLIETPIPEPASLLLLGTGFLSLAALGRKKFARK